MDPANAAIRFVCELVALYGIAAGLLTWTGSVVLTIVLPVATIGLWGAFRVPDDPGPAPVAVPGLLRLLIEGVVFGVGVAGLWAANGPLAGVIFGLAVVIHYASTPRRLRYVISYH